ncbi:MAG: hypothetical protein ACOYXY_00790, partial [Thermodesulfobacteriota bacterium]
LFAKRASPDSSPKTLDLPNGSAANAATPIENAAESLGAIASHMHKRPRFTPNSNTDALSKK